MPGIEERVQRSRLRGRAQSDGELVSNCRSGSAATLQEVVQWNAQ